MYTYLLKISVPVGGPEAKSRHIFRDFIDATANICLAKRDIAVNFQKRAHNPLLIAANFDKTVTPIPWLGNKKLHIVLG